MSDARRYAVWSNPRSRSRSRALKSCKSFHFQKLSLPFTMGADNWPRILKLGHNIWIWWGPNFFILVLVFGLIYFQTLSSCFASQRSVVYQQKVFASQKPEMLGLLKCPVPTVPTCHTLLPEFHCWWWSRWNASKSTITPFRQILTYLTLCMASWAPLCHRPWCSMKFLNFK